jgi:uncharacterized delta-60 repeat protein
MKKTLLFLLFSIVTTAQSLDATFGYNGVSTEYQNTVNSSQVIYDEVIQNNILYQVGYVKRYNSIKGIIVGYNASGIFMQKEVGSVALQTVCFQADDKVLTAGQNKIYRILPDNNFDISFNTSGNQTINFGTFPMNIKCVSTQTDGKIVVSGYVSNGTNNDFAVARLNADGNFDTTFDSDGMQTIAFGTSNEQAFSHKIQSDGKIVVVGESFIANYDFAIVRLNTNGSLDTTFNGTGKKTIDYATSSIDRARSFEILADGKIVIFGQISSSFGCMKLDADGFSLSSDFGGSGIRLFSDTLSITTAILPTSVHFIPKIKVLPDGKMILNGTSNSDVKFIKLQTNGQLDATFGTNGVVVVTNDFDNASSFNIYSSGTIRFTGATTSLTSNGNFKIFYGFISENGLTVNSSTYFFYDENYFKNFEILPDGKIIVILKTSNLTVAKYNTDGSLDVTFGNSGFVELDQIYQDNFYYVLKILNDGKIVVGHDKIYKLNQNGSFDTSFNGNGVFDIYTLTNNKMQHADALYITSDNKIILSSEYETTMPLSANGSTTDFPFCLLRINQNGTIDTSFGTNGFFVNKIHPVANEYSPEYAFKIFKQTDGKLLMVGHHYDLDSFVIRMNENAVIDTTYGVNGIVYLPYSNGYYINDAQILPDDKLLLSSFSSLGVYQTIKLNVNGTFDNSFGVNGFSTDNIGNISYSVFVLPDGKILKAGSKSGQFRVSRYNGDGSIDTTFGVNGEVNVVSLGIDTDWDFVESSFSKILLQPDGKIIAGGNSFDGYSQLSTLVRLTNTTLGTLDFSSTNNALSIYPNPIETTATFEFTLVNPENITIEIYNVQGKLVQTIATNKEMASGNHNLPIELNQNLTSGNYFLKLTTANGSQSIQIIKK